MQQYFIDQEVRIGQQITFDEEQSHHIIHVVRMKKDDIVRISDSRHQLFYARLDMQQKTAYGHIVEAIADHTKTSLDITLIQGLIKGEKWDYLIQKACELGVTKIIPMISSRCVVKIADEKLEKKLIRWNKIALEACEQCKRSTLVKVEKPIRLEDIQTYRSDVNIVAYEEADAESEKLYQVLRQHPDMLSITCVIGSEGGFSKKEVDMLMETGFQRISLGHRILRAETAALSVISNLDFYSDMIGDKHDKN